MTFRLLIVLGLVSVLAACGPLPRPFGRDLGEPPKHLAQNISMDSVEIEPVSGTTQPMGELLARSVIDRLTKDYEIPAAMSGLNKSRYVMTGHVQMPKEAGDGNAGIVIGWQIDVRGGAVLGDYVEEVTATALEWDYGSADVLSQIGKNAAEWAAKQILGERFNQAGTDQLLGRQGVYVTDIAGAPGDGNGALRRAMLVALAGQGLKLADGIEVAAFTLEATVTVGLPENGAQAVRIVWLVKDALGDTLGKAEQANAVPAGSLDGTWGQTAAFVAAAAVDGLVEVIAKNDPSKLRAPDLGAPSFPREEPPPPTRKLRSEPGRAPPPPG